jgi:hypothetical protein
LHDPPKFSQSGIFGLKINHLATLVYSAGVVTHESRVGSSWSPCLQTSCQNWLQNVCLLHPNINTLLGYVLQTWLITLGKLMRPRKKCPLERYNVYVTIHDYEPRKVARWYVFKPKISIWVNFVGPRNEKGWYVYSTAVWNTLRPFGIFQGRFVILWQFCEFSPILVGILCQE